MRRFDAPSDVTEILAAPGLAASAMPTSAVHSMASPTTNTGTSALPSAAVMVATGLTAAGPSDSRATPAGTSRALGQAVGDAMAVAAEGAAAFAVEGAAAFAVDDVAAKLLADHAMAARLPTKALRRVGWVVPAQVSAACV